MSTNTPDISIVIVTWNVRELLRANLSRLFSLQTKHSFEVFVVDNGSHDGTAWMVHEQFPQVQLIKNDWDAGFAGPNNQALRLVKGKVIILLNPDMLVEEGTIDHTFDRLMSDPSIGVMGVKLLNQQEKPINSVRRDPDIWSQVCIILKLQHLFPSLIKRYMREDFDYTISQDVDHVRGSYFAFRDDVLANVGALDADYHIWFEEVDYCKRVRDAGFRIVYDASVTAHDFFGKGVSQMKRLETQLIFTASMIRYFKKWYPWWQSWLIRLVRPFGLGAAILMDAWNGLKSHTL